MNVPDQVLYEASQLRVSGQDIIFEEIPIGRQSWLIGRSSGDYSVIETEEIKVHMVFSHAHVYGVGVSNDKRIVVWWEGDLLEKGSVM